MIGDALHRVMTSLILSFLVFGSSFNSSSAFFKSFGLSFVLKPFQVTQVLVLRSTTDFLQSYLYKSGKPVPISSRLCQIITFFKDKTSSILFVQLRIKMQRPRGKCNWGQIFKCLQNSTLDLIRFMESKPD